MQRSKWQQFRRLLAHEFDCGSLGPILSGSSKGISCDLDFGHKSLHQHFDGEGYWIWKSDRSIVAYVK